MALLLDETPETSANEALSTTTKKRSSHRPLASSLTSRENRVVNALRFTVLILLLATTILVSVTVYLYATNNETNEFVAQFEDGAAQIATSFLDVVERNLGAINTMSTYITSYANHSGQTFPNVTIPDFEFHGSNLRIQGGTHIVHWCPLVWDETREEWEAYALQNRFHIDEAFRKDAELRSRQDADFASHFERQLEDEPQVEAWNETILQDGTGYHPKLWSNGALLPTGDIPFGYGPYLPLWQRSPVSAAKQTQLNLDFSSSKALEGSLDVVLRDRTAVMNRAIVPVPATKARLEANLKISQYRHYVDEYLDDPLSFIAYPVFESLEEGSKVVGVLATNIYWKILFSLQLPGRLRGVLCVVENSFNQTFAYRIDGQEATYMGEGDPHDPKFDRLEFTTEVNSFLELRAEPRTRAYTTVPLNKEVGQYTIRIYPSQETQDEFLTNKPVLYVGVLIAVFAFTSLVFLLYSFLVERRHNIMTTAAIDQANKAAAAERELNEFLSHEVRNPLSAAMSACSFVSVAVNEQASCLVDDQTLQSVREDVETISASLHFINDFLRSSLDIHRATGKELKIDLAPTDLLKDVLEPVSAMVYQRNSNFEIEVDCPENLVILTSCLRLKQVILNLVRNASKFVVRGFIRIRVQVVNERVCVRIEDSGPGIPLDMRRSGLFSKYHESLDLLSQGTGIGLCLSKKLMLAMHGDLWLDESYDSGIAGCPGACFVVETGATPTVLECCSTKLLPQDDDDDKVLATAPLTDLPLQLSILFVDDDVVLRKLFVRAMRKINSSWDIQEAASGEIALRLCESKTFDLIFLDQYMASVDKQLLGTETARTMRSKGVTSVICGLSANDLEQGFLSSGADSFLLKPMPCQREDLQEVLARLLSSSRRRSQGSS